MKNKRKLVNFIINPKYQFKYIFWLTISGFVIILLYSFMFYKYMKENYLILVDLSPMDDSTKKILYKELTEVSFQLLYISLGFLVIISIFGIILSHRVAGPMYHFKKIFKEIKNGNYHSRINLRPKDDFKDVASEFNEMMNLLEKNLNTKKEH